MNWQKAIGRFLGLAACTAFWTFGAGCGGTKVPELFPVSGKVTYQGKPVPGAKIIFFPDVKVDLKKPTPETVSAVADEEGNYELLWGVEGHEGAPEGKYKVAIVALKAYGPEDDTELKPPSLIPEKYGNPQLSGLMATVKDADNVFNFDLTDAGVPRSQ